MCVCVMRASFLSSLASQVLRKLSKSYQKFQNFPHSPTVGCACKVLHSPLLKSSKGLHHGTRCKTMVATYCNMGEIPHVG